MADEETLLIEALEGSASSLMEELAAVRAESERLRHELDAWSRRDGDDHQRAPFDDDVADSDDRPTIPVPCLLTRQTQAQFSQTESSQTMVSTMPAPRASQIVLRGAGPTCPTGLFTDCLWARFDG